MKGLIKDDLYTKMIGLWGWEGAGDKSGNNHNSLNSNINKWKGGKEGEEKENLNSFKSIHYCMR